MAEAFSHPVIVVAGPTASGKSARALALAEAHNGIILNGDALQIYDALPLLTAQPSADDQARALHRLYGILSADIVGSVARWCAQAVVEIEAAWAAGQTPIVVGGTGLYLKSLMAGLSPLPEVPDDIRAASRALQAELGNPGFHAALNKIDPVMATRLRPSDTQRLIRAHEVMVATGKSLAAWQDVPPTPPLPQAQFHRILVDGDRATLRARAQTRLRQMVDMGVLDEVAEFAARIASGELASDCVPTQALGYHAFVAAAQGEMGLESAIAAAEIETGQYIKRQQTWLRHQMTFDETIMVD